MPSDQERERREMAEELYVLAFPDQENAYLRQQLDDARQALERIASSTASTMQDLQQRVSVHQGIHNPSSDARVAAFELALDRLRRIAELAKGWSGG